MFFVALNNTETDNIQNMKNLSNLTTEIGVNEFSYLSEKFDTSFANDQEDINYADINMDSNYKNEADNFSNALNSWVSSGTDPIEDDGFQDDNVSHVGSDYSELQSVEPDNLLGQNTPTDLYSGQLSEFVASELILRPPSGSEMHFNYNIPAMPSQRQPTYNPSNVHHNSTLMSNNAELSSLYGNQSDTGSSSMAAASSSSASAANYSRKSFSNTGCPHPNMWYPNVAFGTYRSHGSDYGHNYASQAPPDHATDIFQLSNSREARNRAEKNRRDKLNRSIQEISTKVPHVAESPRRVDKTTVLRFAAHGLRLRYVFGKSLNNTSTQTTDALMKLLDSFFLTVTCNGQIVLVSPSVEQHLGHCQTDLYGQNILNFTHPEDHQLLKEKVVPTDINNLFDIQPGGEAAEPIERTQAEEDEIDRRLREDKRIFTIRLARSGLKSEPTVYELVKLDGSFRRSDMAPRGLKISTFPSSLQLMRRSKGRDDIMPQHAISGNDIVLVAIASIVRPPVINRSIQVNQLEYKTRHLIDGCIIDCDQRISLVAGYMTDEVRNLSPFTFIHQDDVRWVIVALRQMYDCRSSYGESSYRLFTRNGKIIYLHTKGFLEIDKNSNNVHSFICVNTLLDEEEGKRRVEHMKKKFSVIISTKIPQSMIDVPASENPKQLEKAVLCLIHNLKSNPDDESDSDSSLFSAKSHQNPYQHFGNTSPQLARSTKTPPLALVPPATDCIKKSITKSVNVVNTTVAKFLHSTIPSSSQQQIVVDSASGPSMSDNVENILFTHDTDNPYLTNTEEQVSGHYTTSGAIKRKLSHTMSETDTDDYIVPMQRQAIENVLSNSLEQINNRLHQQLNTAMELRDQGQRYEVPHAEKRIADIMKEHQEQQELYKNITNEFEVQQRKRGSAPTDTELLHECVTNDLEEFQQSHDQEVQQQQQQQQQQYSTQTLAATTNLNSATKF